MEISNSILSENASDVPPSSQQNEIVKLVAKIINFPISNDWSIVDQNEHLVLVHYSDTADMNMYGILRGVLVDTEVGAVIADSFGYTPTTIASSLTSVDGNLTLRDKNNTSHVLPIGNIIIKPVFEGIVMRIIWHKKKCYQITYRKINPYRSRWGYSKTFTSLYQEAGGPAPEQLFDTTKSYSNTVYDFLIVDQSFLIASRQRVNKPYLVFLTKRTMNIKRPVDETASGTIKFEMREKITGIVNESFILNVKSFTLEEANKHLMFGYYNKFDIKS